MEVWTDHGEKASFRRPEGSCIQKGKYEMNILITGSAGFVGRNLAENLKSIRDGKNRTRPDLKINEIYEYDIESTPEQLDEYCAEADFVFNLAGVNRPKDPAEFKAGNYGFASTLLNRLKAHDNKCPVMLSSSLQAALAGRFGRSEYGLSKRDGEELFFRYAAETGAAVYVYRFPNLAGKWARPNYNSAVGTFCHNIANDLPITVNDLSVELELLFVEDLIEEMYDAIEGKPHRAEYPNPGEVVDGVAYDGLTPRPCKNGRYCYAPLSHKATLGRIVELLNSFHDQPLTTMVPDLTPGSFEKKLYSMYISYLPKEKTAYPLKMNVDARGSFTELLHTASAGQVSVNISKPGIKKGGHWHNSKLERFIVVSGHGLIQMRSLLTGEVREFDVSGNKLEVVQTLPGWTHNIINLSDTEALITVIWCNEVFDPIHPDTFGEPVIKSGQ